jgi:hypothetical protein
MEGQSSPIRADLAAMIAAFPAAVRTVQRALFGMHLVENVRTASPLLGVITEIDGVDFNEAALRILPPPSWPEVPMPRASSYLRRSMELKFVFKPDQILRRHRRVGSIVCASAVSDDIIAVRVLGNTLELTAIDGGLRIETFAGIARILIDGALPNVVTSAVRGRRIGEMVSHRWLDEREWPIIAVEAGHGRSSIYFGTGEDDWSFPVDPTAIALNALDTRK